MGNLRQVQGGPQTGARRGGDPEVSERGWSLLQNQCHGLLPVLPLEGQGARQHLKLQRTRVCSGSGPISHAPTSSHPSHSAPGLGAPPGSRTASAPPHSVNQTTRNSTRGPKLGRGPAQGWGLSLESFQGRKLQLGGG